MGGCKSCKSYCQGGGFSQNCLMPYQFFCLTPELPTPQNGQTHSNNLSANYRRIV